MLTYCHRKPGITTLRTDYAPGVVLATKRDEVLVVVRERYRLDAVTVKNKLRVHCTRLKVPYNHFRLHARTH